MEKYAIMGIFPGSSMVEQEAVNFEVASSSLARGAIFFFEKTQKARLGPPPSAPVRVWPGEYLHFG